MNKNIVCATDFSSAATRTTDAAAALARKSGDTLVLLHVCEVSHAAGESLSSSLHVAAMHRLHSEANRLRQSGTEVEELLLDGSPSSAILTFLDQTPIRLFILASQKKRSAPARWFSGGLIERILRQSGTPTLVVRDAEVLEQWLSGEKPLRVFVATNLSTSADIPLHWVKELASIAPCEITAAYLNWVPDEVIRLGLPHRALFEESRQLQTLLEKELHDKVTEILGDHPVRVHVEPRWGRADLPLIGIAEMENADLLVTGTRLLQGLSRIFDESVSLDLLHNSPLNLAVVPLLETVVERPLPVIDCILVPTDFSDAANHAIPYACTIACPGATIHLLHVKDRFGVSLAEGTEQLKALIPQGALDKGIRFETEVETGDHAADCILQTAARRRADVICMGTSGRSGISRSLLGSVASAVTSVSDRPVLLVPKPI